MLFNPTGHSHFPWGSVVFSPKGFTIFPMGATGAVGTLKKSSKVEKSLRKTRENSLKKVENNYLQSFKFKVQSFYVDCDFEISQTQFNVL